MFNIKNFFIIDISNFPIRVKIAIYINEWTKLILSLPTIFYAKLICKNNINNKYKIIIQILKYPQLIFSKLSQFFLSILDEALNIFLFIPKKYR